MRIILLATMLAGAAMTGTKTEVSSNGTEAIIGVHHANADSRELMLEFNEKGGQPLCWLDYTSQDGKHGFRIVRSAWSKDGRFYVWSTQSSGGHSPWHFPTAMFDSSDGRVYQLDRSVDEPGISDGDFEITTADEVETYVYADKPKKVKISLKDVVNKTATEAQICSEGIVHRYGETME